MVPEQEASCPRPSRVLLRGTGGYRPHLGPTPEHQAPAEQARCLHSRLNSTRLPCSSHGSPRLPPCSKDCAPALLVLDAQVRVQGAGGIRQFPLAELYSGEGRTPLALEPSDVVTA